MEAQILLWIQENLRTDWLNPIVEAITSLGNAGWFWMVLVTLLLLRKEHRECGFRGWVAIAIGFLITNLLLKNMVARVRPYDAIEGLYVLGSIPHDFSFPSGHSTCSMAAAWVIWKKEKKPYATIALILAILICLSRLYVGVHYPTDVVAGAIIGIIAAMIALRVPCPRICKNEISLGG